MAHFAVSLANIAVEIEDEDADAKDLAKLGMKTLGEIVEKFLVDVEEEDD